MRTFTVGSRVTVKTRFREATRGKIVGIRETGRGKWFEVLLPGADKSFAVRESALS